MGSADIIEFYGLSGYLKSGEGDIIKFKNGQNTNNNFSPGSGSVRSHSATPDPKPEGKKENEYQHHLVRHREPETSSSLEWLPLRCDSNSTRKTRRSRRKIIS